MGNKIKTVILTGLIILISFSFYSMDKCFMNEKDIEHEKNEWKKMAVCLCLYESIPLNDSIKRDDGSLAAYVQTNSLFGIDDFEETQLFISNYLDSVKYNSKTGRSLSVMKCLDLYDSIELNNFVDRLADNVMKETER